MMAPVQHDPTTDQSRVRRRYRALARAVILQAVKDCASRVQGDGQVRYRDHGRSTQDAESARSFLSTISPELTFWCLWLDIHPEVIMAGAVLLPLGLPAVAMPPPSDRVH
jgi:hypothetical protein